MANVLTVSQTATRLDVAISTIHEWIDAGLLPHAYQIAPRKNSPWRIPVDDVIAIEKYRKGEQIAA